MKQLVFNKMFVKIENLKRFFIQNIRCSTGNDFANMNMIIEVGRKQTTLGKGVVKNSVKINTPHICHNHHNCKSVKGNTQFCRETTFVANLDTSVNCLASNCGCVNKTTKMSYTNLALVKGPRVFITTSQINLFSNKLFLPV